MNKSERRAMMIGIVENQLRDNDPPETRKTLDRLMASGHDREEAMRLIACVVASEIFHVMKYKREFDRGRYAMHLDLLPTMPWDAGED